LDTVDAAREWRGIGRSAFALVAAERVRDRTELLGRAADLALEEARALELRPERS
jgi:hypothetical protein